MTGRRTKPTLPAGATRQVVKRVSDLQRRVQRIENTVGRTAVRGRYVAAKSTGAKKPPERGESDKVEEFPVPSLIGFFEGPHDLAERTTHKHRGGGAEQADEQDK